MVGLRSAEVAGVCRIRGQRSPAEDPGLVWVASLQKAGTGTISGSKLQQERALPSVPTWKREGGKKEKKNTQFTHASFCFDFAAVYKCLTKGIKATCVGVG